MNNWIKYIKISLVSLFFILTVIFTSGLLRSELYPADTTTGESIDISGNILHYKGEKILPDSASLAADKRTRDTLIYPKFNVSYFADLTQTRTKAQDFLKIKPSFFSNYRPNREAIKRAMIEEQIVNHCFVFKNKLFFKQYDYQRKMVLLEEQVSDKVAEFESKRWEVLGICILLIVSLITTTWFLPNVSFFAPQPESTHVKEIQEQWMNKSTLINQIWADLGISELPQEYAEWRKAIDNANKLGAIEKEITMQVTLTNLPSGELTQETPHLYYALGILEQLMPCIVEKDQAKVQSILKNSEADLTELLELRSTLVPFVKNCFNQVGLDESKYNDSQEQSKIFAKFTTDTFFEEYTSAIEIIKKSASKNTFQETIKKQEAQLDSLRKKYGTNSSFNEVINFLEQISIRNLNDMFVRNLLMPRVAEFSKLADQSEWPDPLSAQYKTALMKFFLSIGVPVFDYCNYRFLYESDPSQLRENQYSPTKDMVVKKAPAAEIATEKQYFGQSYARDDDFVRAIYNIAKEFKVDSIDGFVKGYFIAPNLLND